MSKAANQSKATRGGSRPGAGRKPSTVKGIVKKLPSDSAALILAEIKANQKWVTLAASKDERIVLETLKYLTDRAYGKAKQALEHSGPNGGPIEHEVIDLARLDNEQLAELESLVESATANPETD